MCYRNVYTLQSKDGSSSVYVLLHRRLLNFRSYVGSLGLTSSCPVQSLDTNTTLLLTSCRVLLSSAAAFCAPTVKNSTRNDKNSGSNSSEGSRFVVLPAECCVWQLNCLVPKDLAIVREVFCNLLLPNFTADAAANNNNNYVR